MSLTPIDRISNAADVADASVALLDDFSNGDHTKDVITDNGTIPSIAKFIKDQDTRITNNLGDLLQVMRLRGVHSANTGSYPTTPENGDTYFISVDGTINGTVMKENDLIVYLSDNLTWYHIPNMTTNDIQLMIDPVIDNAPSNLNTLKKIATSLGNNSTLSITLNQLISNVNTRVTNLTNGQVKTNKNNITALNNRTSNIDNTSDVDKPISNDTQQALDSIVNTINNNNTNNNQRLDEIEILAYAGIVL